MYSTKTKSKQPSPSKKRLILILLAAAAVLALLVIGILEATNRIHLFGDDLDGPSTSLNENTKGQPPQKADDKDGTGGTAGPAQGGSATGQKSGDAPSAAPKTLLAPQGTFVSNHRPSLSAPGQNLEQSTCTTTPGAACYIRFTKDGITKQLEAKTTDAGGSAYWSWRISDLGLTKGVWKVTAVATLDGQTKTTDDSLNLEVSD